MDEEEGDQRLPHQLHKDVYLTQEDLDKYGVLSWSGINGAG